MRASADSLAPIADASADAVTTRSVLIYVKDKAAALREFHRVLRPGGRVSVFEPVNRLMKDQPGRCCPMASRAGIIGYWERTWQHDQVYQVRYLTTKPGQAGEGDGHGYVRADPWRRRCRVVLAPGGGRIAAARPRHPRPRPAV